MAGDAGGTVAFKILEHFRVWLVGVDNWLLMLAGGPPNQCLQRIAAHIRANVKNDRLAGKRRNVKMVLAASLASAAPNISNASQA